MFKSIRWKFITIYFLLVFIAMIIVGVFIINEFQDLQIEHITESMNQTVEDVVDTITFSPKVKENKWGEFIIELQNNIEGWHLSPTDKLYILSKINPYDDSNVSQTLKIVAINPSTNKKFIGEDAYFNNEINNELLLDVLKSKKMMESTTNKGAMKHVAYPYIDDNDELKLIIYVTSDLENINGNITESKRILINATLLALIITVILGFIIARSIAEPIKDVTIKAEKMVKGDYNQHVEVKSNDEIGDLASMFNSLTQQLRYTVSELENENDKLETLFETMTDGLMAVDTDGNILHANPVACELLDLQNEELKNINHNDLFKGLCNNMTLENIKDNDTWEGTEIVSIKQGIFNVKYAPINNKLGDISGLLIVLQNITEQQKLENMRKEFVANVSHELKTPLTSIKSYTETIIDGAIDDRETSIEFLNVINDNCDRMYRIVRDLLMLSSLDFNQINWDRKRLDVKELINTCYMKMKMPAKEKKQIIELDIDESVNDIYGDSDRIQQVLLNIISNAVKYTGEKGLIKIRAYNNENEVVVSVKDNGMGIPREDLNRIFERFYRVDKARSREMGGTGLGLSIAKQIIDAHDGKIEIDSVFNEGTEVKIIMPIEQREKILIENV